uniref:Metalloendopeptidase n=1 Tax=Panagrolaimus sp. ES5 TaxID=591445 RepID=A0AC34GW96_9BILA
MKQFILLILFAHFLSPSLGQISALFHSFTNSLPFPAYNKIKPDPLWIQSGKFQGDIDGIDSRILNHLGTTVMLNALKNKQLTWTDGNVPYEMDDAFTQGEVRLIERAFNSYKKRTCIRFKKRIDETDYLYITKGFGCYSQVGRTGGKQELSLGRGCLFHEIIVHELMHSLGFWHEHSRIDRDDHIRIKWENILPGMKSQFDIISGALQDTLGENYDYRSIMHYDSTAFSRNGQNTIETVVDGFTGIIGSATDLSDLDVVKIGKLYRCSSKKEEEIKTTLPKKKTTKSASTELVTKARTTLPPSDIPFSSSPTPSKKKGILLLTAFFEYASIQFF